MGDLFGLLLVLGYWTPILVPIAIAVLRTRGGRAAQRIAAALILLPAAVITPRATYFIVTFDDHFDRITFWRTMTDGGVVFAFVVFWTLVAFNLVIWLGCGRASRYWPAVPTHFRCMNRPIIWSVIMLLILTSVPTIYLKQYVTLEKAVQSGNVELARKRLQFNLLGVGARNGYIMRISSIGTIPGPLMPVAAQTGNVQMARLLMAHGATADDRNQFMSPPVTEAAMKGHADMVEFLLQNGAIADEAWPGSYNDYPRIVEIVLEYGGSPDLGLRSAATAGSIESLELLLDKGADINYVDATGYSVLDYAGSAHVSDAFDFILSQGGKLHNLGPAVRTGNLRVVKLGLDQGVNPNGQPEGDYTFPPLVEAMMYLTVHGDDGRLNRAATPDVYLSIVEALLRAGADANIDSKFGTPLSVIVGAALSLEEERECLMPMLISAVELLVAFGADPTCIPSNSQEQYSPLELARTFGRRELLDAMTASIP